MLNVNSHGSWSPPCSKSDEYSRLPVILQPIFPLLLINMEQTEDIVQGMCPTTCKLPSISFTIATTCHYLILVDRKLLPQQMDRAKWIGRCGNQGVRHLLKSHTVMAEINWNHIVKSEMTARNQKSLNEKDHRNHLKNHIIV